MNFSELLIQWYKKNQRKLPWRNTRNPYLIWISEIILQQTRVNQGFEYYLRFTERFPDVISLANAKEEEVLRLWQGLGYYTRARNIYHAAQQIIHDFNGVFPADYNDIIKLKGIGSYSASAIASIAFKQCYPVIDGNVLRVISRIYGISIPVDSAKGKNEIKAILYELIDKQNPDIFNQAIMEIGALVCSPKSPQCEICPLQALCFAYAEKKTADFPIKGKKISQRSRYFYYLLIIQKQGEEKYIYLHKRTKNDIWKNMYDFPLIETESEININEYLLSEIDALLKSYDFVIQSVSPTFKHQLTHQTIYARFIKIEISLPNLILKDCSLTIPGNINNYPIPKLIDNYLKTDK
ncbi:MAG: A/G-specific adenine glycosylase [Bacteroidetes bacterium]|nr:A/G-specific adenine glycosylase [Bacteroidota bacterium]